MAFTAQLTDPDTRAFDSGISPARTGGESELASLISGGLQVFQVMEKRKEFEAGKLQEAQEKQAAQQLIVDKDKAMAGAASSALDVNSEALSQRGEYDEIQQRMYALKQDGITSSEQVYLEDLQMKADRLKLVDPKQQQIRLNALHKQALNSSIGLNVQAEINSIFGSGRAAVDDYKAPEYPPAITKELQERYGTTSGVYTPEQVSSATSKVFATENALKQASLNIAYATAYTEQATTNLGQNILADTSKLITQKGGLSEEDRANVLGRFESARLQALQQVSQLAQVHAKQGRDVTQQIKEMNARVNASFDNMTSLFTAEGAMGDSVMLNKRLNQYVSMIDNVNKLNIPQLGTIVSGVSGKGIDPEGLLQLMKADDAVLSEYLGSSNVQEIKLNLAKAFEASTNPQGLQDLISRGLIPPSVAKLAAANGIAPFANNAEQLSDALEVFTSGITKDTIGATIDATLATKTIEKAREFKGDARLSSTLQSAAIRFGDEIYTMIPNNLKKNLSVSSTGDLSIAGTPPASMRAQVMEINRVLDKFNKFTSVYDVELGGKKKVAETFYLEVNPKEEQTSETKSTKVEFGSLEQEAAKQFLDPATTLLRRMKEEKAAEGLKAEEESERYRIERSSILAQ